MTISPNLLEELQTGSGSVPKKLDAAHASSKNQIEQLHLDEKKFRWLHNEDPMASEKLADGIRVFAADSIKLKKFIQQKLAAL